MGHCQSRRWSIFDLHYLCVTYSKYQENNNLVFNILLDWSQPRLQVWISPYFPLSVWYSGLITGSWSRKVHRDLSKKLHNVVENLCRGWNGRWDSIHRRPADTDARSLTEKCGAVDHRGSVQIWSVIDLKMAQPVTAGPQLLTRLSAAGWMYASCF